MASVVADVRRVGEGALLIEAARPDAVAAIAAELRVRADAAGWRVADVVPAAKTVLVDGIAGGDVDTVARALGAWEVVPLPEGAGPLVELPVVFDGDDLDDVASLWSVTAGDVVEQVTALELRVAFCGFAPGFGYLTGLPSDRAVPRHATPRTRVPAGAFGLAGPYAGVYPRASPGGWRLLGRLADHAPVLWDPARDSPALLTPGTRVRVVDAGERARVRRAQDSDAPRTPSPSRSGGGGAGLSPSEGGARARAAAGLRIERSGALATVQDLGRPGFAHLGVPRSGAADAGAHRRANALVGNEPDAATIEATATGCAVRALSDLVVAVAGARCPVWVGDVPAPFGSPVRLRAGQTVELGSTESGLRSYLAVRGGIRAEPVLGSRATDVLSGLGPDPLRDGDELAVGAAAPLDDAAFASLRALAGGARDGGRREGRTVELTLVPGPRADWFTAGAHESLTDADYTVTGESNRVGVRFDGPTLERATTDELASEGVVLGAVQVPPSGLPVVFLADHPTTGGYPVIGVLDTDSVARAAQLRPGDRVRFRPIADEPR